jgi:beta-lactamase regulating signal transducer with metallopeptidase domain
MPILAYRVPSEMPLAAIVGVVRPRLFVSDQFLDALTADERQAVLEHEMGHLRSLDNLKRTAMSLAPDWLAFFSAGREIEAAWAISAEEEADDHAVGPDRARSLDLGSALLKASRLMPMRPASASAFYDGAPIARRVARLLSDPPSPPGPGRAGAPLVAWILASMVAVAPLAPPVFRVAYAMTESAVRLLQ